MRRYDKPGELCKPKKEERDRRGGEERKGMGMGGSYATKVAES